MAVKNIHQRILALSTVSAGADIILELHRRGVAIHTVVGLHPDSADPEQVSGWIDTAKLAAQVGASNLYVDTYGLKSASDRERIEALRPDLVLVTGWQRLIPEWLIDCSTFGALGSHGSADGIQGGRGRSPQNWALMLGARRFEISLFRISPGIDDGPVLASRSFFYEENDDIKISHFRVALACADMIAEVLDDPHRLEHGAPQSGESFYYPQRKPNDGWVDWQLPSSVIERHCRALTKPYPGLRTSDGDAEVRIWRCSKFDDAVDELPGTIGACFHSGEFLVSCSDGRLIVREWSSDSEWRPEPGRHLQGRAWIEQLREILQRHEAKFAEMKVVPRLTRLARNHSQSR